MQRLALVVVAFTGCSVEPSQPTATVTVRSGQGVPLADWPVAFHGSDGRLLDSMLTDAHGTAEGSMEVDGMVTYRAAVLGSALVTRGGVQPGDHVTNMVLAEPPAATSATLIVDTTNVPAAARLCRVVIACGDRAIEGRSTPGADIVMSIPETCGPADADGKRVVFLLATATDERAEAIAFARLDRLAIPTQPTRITLDLWRTDFIDVPVEIAGVDPDVDRYGIDVTAYIEDAPVAGVRLGETDGLSSTVRLPVDTGTTVLDVTAWYPTDEIRISATFATGAPLVLGAADLPPRMTEIALEDETIRFHTEQPLDPSAIIAAVLVDGRGGSWTFKNMSGATIRLPELPSAYQIAPSSELRLQLVGARVRVESDTGSVVSTTANPYMSSLSELPFGSPGE